MSQPLAEALKPEEPVLYQTNPIAVVTATAASEISSRVRSSCRWSIRDMVRSGVVRL
jgi:hypothetical protein